MTNREEVLTKVVAIAKRNGYLISDAFFTEIPAGQWLLKNQNLYLSIVLTKDFAVSFWGEDDFMESEEISSQDTKVVNLEDYDNPVAFLLSNPEHICIPSWQYHLMHAVMLEPEEVLDYYASFIKERDNSVKL